MSSTKCVHCGAESDPATTGGYCVVCGAQGAEARTARAGVCANATADETLAQAKRTASHALLGVAGLYLVFLVAGLVITVWVQPAQEPIPQALRIANMSVVAVFGMLGLWARSKPFPASLVGMILYAVLTIGCVVAGSARDFALGIMLMILFALGCAVVVSGRARRRAE